MMISKEISPPVSPGIIDLAETVRSGIICGFRAGDERDNIVRIYGGGDDRCQDKLILSYGDVEFFFEEEHDRHSLMFSYIYPGQSDSSRVTGGPCFDIDAHGLAPEMIIDHFLGWLVSNKISFTYSSDRDLEDNKFISINGNAEACFGLAENGNYTLQKIMLFSGFPRKT
ncbi:hypothetical protein [Chelatococcus asaccharovorans]|uniref:hypothetical protein n=1 Tax=Chelatococcus asaccharovorans TaxID=28210 RepID=UPI0011B6C02F|nr:hypothetical protein [Chelatococcus asaccharovorans]MBS7704760.1 hypothetical protein [Chelatococcus asaccharovorans]